MSADAALVDLLHYLRRHGYRFTAVTPSTHEIVLSRPLDRRPDLRDIFGWSREFDRADVDAALWTILEDAEAVAETAEGRLRSLVRVASLGDDLFLHSAFPTEQADAVFFGPDTYRFERFVRLNLPRSGTVVDMGAGTGAGAIAAARRMHAPRVVLVDVNAKALRFAQVNAAAAGIEVEAVQSDQVPDDFDVLIGNPPYLMDGLGRSYRHGGDLFGGAVALQWMNQGLDRLAAGRTILLYTGAAYVRGSAPLLLEIAKQCRAAGAILDVQEIDPDLFGEQLQEAAYGEVERIAAVGIKVEKAGAA